MLDKLRERYDRGEYLAVKRLAGGMLSSDDYSPETKAAAGVLGSRAAMTLREPALAGAYAQRALGFAQECENTELEGRALFQLAAARLAIGDNADARVYLREFLDGLAERWPSLDDELGARAYGNLGMVLRSQRLFADALKAYTQCLARLQRAGDVRGEVMCRHQTAYVLMLIDAHDEAGDHLAKASSLTPFPSDLAAHQLTHEALHFLYTGDFLKALERAEEVLQPGRPDVGMSSIAVAWYVLGSVSLERGALELAEKYAQLAQEAAVNDGLASTMNLVSKLTRALRKAKAQRDDT